MVSTKGFNNKNIIGAALFFMVFSFHLQHAGAATMNDYCITPPYVGSGITPNLLLMIDNSSSMYDLAYQDTASKYCANAPTTSCTTDSTCSAGGMPTAYCLASATTTTTSTKLACNADADCQPPKPGGVTGDTCILTGPKSGRNLCTTASTNIAATTPISCTTDANCTLVAGDICNNKCSASRQCYDTTYSDTVAYTGYFDRTATYGYDFTNNKFTSPATPLACTYQAPGIGTPYVCLTTSGTGAAETATGFVARGNFLNWLTMSKFDIEKQILTGGKYDTVNNVLIAENRGCAGRKFLKSVPGMNVTFAIRGGTLGGISSTTSLAAEYGQAYIGILTGTYNVSACLSAMNDWMNVTSPTPPNLGTFQNDSKSCVGAGSGALNATNLWNHVLHNCYQGMTGGAQGYSTNLVSLEGDCQGIYASIAPSAITDPNAGYSICSSVLSYTDPSGAAQTGYLGACWNGTDFNGPCKDTLGNPAPNALTQMSNFCQVNVSQQPVMDPSSTAISGSGQGAPGFIMEQGLMNLVSVATLTVKVGLAAPPAGLIGQYQNQIRFGTMTFQNNGSASECSSTSVVPCMKTCSLTATRVCVLNSDCPSGETCVVTTPTDGGKIISYVGAGNCSATTATACTVDNDCPLNETCVPKVGDHGTGFIKAIDDIKATSWTPLNEAFYNAIGYFARTNPYDGSNPASRNFNFTSLPISYGTTTTAGFNPSQKKCQKNNILLVTDGMSTADQNSASEGLANLYSSQTPAPYTGASGYDATHTCPPYKGSRSLPTLAWAAKNLSIKTLTTSAPASVLPTNAPADSSEQIYTYVVYAGPPSGPDSGTTSGLCDPYRLINTTATNGGTSLLYASSDPSLLYTNIKSALDQVAARAASGTAASVLASGEGSGANLIQAVFYPRRRFPNSNEIAWTGRLTNLWYYVDPFFSMSSIREDDEGLTGDKTLNLLTDAAHHDYITQLYYDKIKGATVAYRWNSDAIGNVGAQVTTPAAAINFEDLSSLWEAGTLLWQRDPNARKLISTISSGPTWTTIPFTTAPANVAALAPYMLPSGDVTTASNIISWVTGSDVAGYRSRTVSMTVSGVTSTNVWKLGDVVNSTPKLASWMPLNSYHKFYQDSTYGIPGSDANLESPADPTHFVTTQAYKNRGMIFAGGNDGMLHAFKLGTLQLKWSGQGASEVARLVNPDTGAVCSSSDTAPCGQETWAYIPKNALPYLQYMADPAYCHVYSVDLTPFIFDASILPPTSAAAPDAVRDVNSWRTIVIGAMRFGGACRDATATCNGGTTDCVKTPMTGAGYSSYFALDVTDQNNPTLLWEFSSNQLGFATSGPAVVRIDGVVGGLPNNSTNGNWFVVIGSGPTGPISTGDRQFLGRSDQSLKLFILDLKSGTLLRTMDSLPNEPNIPNAFAGSLIGAPLDASLDYQDDVLYVPYVKKCAALKAAPAPSTRNICDPSAPSVWTDGGVGRLVTHKSPNPANWTWSTLIDGVGPVTTAVTKLQDPINNILWVYFGTGRYYYVQATVSDDAKGQRYLFGVKDPCLTASGTYDPACTTSVLAGDPTDVTDNVPTTVAKGWFIRLDIDGNTVTTDPSTAYLAERVITDPLASARGVVYFTSYKPYSNLCDLGGKSFIWAVQYNTGGQPTNLKGKVLIQVSTGAIEQKDLSTAFTDKGNRRTAAMEGKPPEAQGMSALTQPSPARKIVHIREK